MISTDLEQQTVINVTLDYFTIDFNCVDLLHASSNSSKTEDRHTLTGKDLWREIPLGIVLTLLCLITTVGNAVVLHAVRTERRLQSVSNMFIVSLAIADLIVGLIVMPVSTMYIFTKDWKFGIAVCQIWIGIDYTVSTASILNLFILSLDRYWSVTSPLKYIRKRTRKRAMLMITVVWILSSLWIIPIAGWHHLFNGGKRTIPSNVCDTEYAKNSVLKVVTAFFNFYLPLTVMYGLYWQIFQEIRKRSKLELGQRNFKYTTSVISNVNSCHNAHSYSDHSYVTESDRKLEPYLETSVNRTLSNSCLYDMSKLQSLHTETKRKHLIMRFFSKQPPKPVTHRNHVQEEIEPVIERTKMEYISGENGMEQETGKAERCFYVDSKPNGILLRNNSNISGELSLSSPSTPISSCSSSDEKQAKSKESYSLANGVLKIREVETIIDRTVATVCTTRSSRNAPFLRDERTQHSSTNINNKRRRNNVNQSSSLTKEIKAARQLGVIMGVFTFCLLPYFIIFLVVAFCNGCIDQGLLLAMTWIGYLNSTLNPFLYPLCNASFRRKFRVMLWLMAKRSRYRKDNRGH